MGGSQPATRPNARKKGRKSKRTTTKKPTSRRALVMKKGKVKYLSKKRKK